jgi:hypothetical protein
VGPVSAEWRLVDNFEDPSTLELWSITSDANAQIPGRIEYVDDPVASGQGKVLCMVTPIGGETGPAHSSIIYPLGDLAIKDDLFNIDKRQTVYFKLMRPLVDGGPGELDTTIGLMSSTVWAKESGVFPPVNEEPDTIPSYGSYSTIVRYERDGIFDVWDGTPRYHDCSDTAQEANVWYEVWMVHSHGRNTYQVYIKGGSDFPEQTLVTNEAVIDEFTTHFAGNTAHYRVRTFEDLDWFMVRPNGGSISLARGKDNTYLDDFYIDNDGENLSSPAALQVMDALSLKIEYTEGSIRLSWVETEEGPFLETADTLAHPIPWKRVNETLESNGNLLSVSLEANDRARFFRLSKP